MPCRPARKAYRDCRTEPGALDMKQQAYIVPLIPYSYPGSDREMEILRSLIVAGLLVAVAGSVVCPLAGATSATLPDMSQQFSGLPMEDLIGGPLAAAIRAQQQLAATHFDFLMGVGLEEFSGGAFGMGGTLQELV